MVAARQGVVRVDLLKQQIKEAVRSLEGLPPVRTLQLQACSKDAFAHPEGCQSRHFHTTQFQLGGQYCRTRPLGDFIHRQQSSSTFRARGRAVVPSRGRDTRRDPLRVTAR